MTLDLTPFGLAVGHATDEDGGTGCTVVRGLDGPFRAGVAVAGRATGTRDFGTLDPAHLVDRVDALLLTGGSAYGLDAAAGVMRWMEEHGRGFDVGAGVVPIVPAAVIFDLTPCGRFDARPTPDMAYRACAAATPSGIAEGSVGAGTGATVGKGSGPSRCMKGGVGLWGVAAGGVQVAALVVTNAFGDVRDGDGRILAGARAEGGGFVDTARALAGVPSDPGFARLASFNTTLAVVMTSAALTRQELTTLARSATAALYRRITPVATHLDGDVVFAVAPRTGAAGALPQIEQLAIGSLEAAIERSVRRAAGRDGVPGLADPS